MNPRSFEELKLSGDLPSPAGVGLEILHLTRTDEYEVEEMARVLLSDSVLTARILRLANSASRSAADPVTTVPESIMRLGSRAVRNLALAFSLVSNRKAGTCAQFDYERYWSTSLARAVAAQELCRVRPVAAPAEAFVCGLLGEIGQLALATAHADRYGAILHGHDGDDPARLLSAEREHFGIDHADVARCLLAEWNLPESIVDAVGRFGSRVDDGVRIADLADVLRHADVVAELCVVEDGAPALELARIARGLDAVRGMLEVDQFGLARFCESCRREWVAWGESLGVAASGRRLEDALAAVAEARRAVSGGEAAGPLRRPATERGTDGPEGAVSAKGGADGLDPEGRISVLVVAHDPRELRALVGLLRSHGFAVEMARGGRQGLEVALRRTPEILLVDQALPDLPGHEVVRTLRRTVDGGRMYALLATESDDEDHLVRAFDVGADDFVAKPFVERLLLARIQSGVRIARLQRRLQADRRTILGQIAELGILHRRLAEAAVTDELTGLPNRRFAMLRLRGEWSESRRGGRPLSVVLLDLDRFKSVNDGFGHDVGDRVLRAAAAAIRGALRIEDEACRVGGEEFLMILRETTERHAARIAERVRAAVAAVGVDVSGFDRTITASLGVAGTDACGGDTGLDELLRAADAAAYASKRAGRDRVTRAGTIARSPAAAARDDAPRARQ